MSVLSDSIKDNLNRNLSNQELYLQQINSLPKGKIVIRKKRNSDYYYLQYRDKDKVIYDYLGPVSSFDISSLQNQINERNIYKDRLKNLKEEEKEMKKILKSIGEL